MESSSSPRIECPRCGSRYPWREALAGKQLKCRCGEAFVPSPPTDAQEAASPASPLPPRSKLSGHYAQMTQYTSSVAQALEDRVDEAKPSRFSEVYLPAATLSVGALVAFILCMSFTHGFVEGVVTEAVALGLQAFVLLPALVVCTMLVAQWFELGLGTLQSGLWKTAAITFGPAAVADVLFATTMVVADFDWQTLIAGFGYYVILCIAPLCLLFAINVYESALLVALMFVPRVALIFTLHTLWPTFIE